MNNGIPPRSRNHRLPAACDAPTATAASSLVSPLAISRQNSRSTSRRSDGAPGDFIADRPVNSFIHPAGLPINTSTLEVLQRPVDSSLGAVIGMYDRLVGFRFPSENGHTDGVGDQFGAHMRGDRPADD